MRWFAIIISFSFFVLAAFSLLMPLAQAQEQQELTITKPAATPSTQTLPQVGKHVGANMDAMTMIVALLMVLAIIIVSAFILKRFQPVKVNGKGLKVITSMSLGAKERLIVIQVGDKQQLLGVTSHQISLLDTLEKPLEISAPITSEISQSVVSLVQKHLLNKKNTTKEESA